CWNESSIYREATKWYMVKQVFQLAGRDTWTATSASLFFHRLLQHVCCWVDAMKQQVERTANQQECDAHDRVSRVGDNRADSKSQRGDRKNNRNDRGGIGQP